MSDIHERPTEALAGALAEAVVPGVAGTRDVLDALRDAVLSNDGLSLVLGHVGAGKRLLADQFLQEAQAADALVIRVADPEAEEDLVGVVATALGGIRPTLDRPSRLRAILERLVKHADVDARWCWSSSRASG